MFHTRLFRPGALRPRALLALPLVIGALAVGACVPTPTGPTTTTSTTVPTGPAVVGHACAPGQGVTVVVDFTELDDTVRIGCAPGTQASGLTALAAAGFATTDATGPGTVCTIDALPSQGFPFCWSTGDGYWSYWKSPNSSTAWDFAPTGPGAGPIAVGAVEGWSWAPAYVGQAPRVSIAGLGAYTPAG